MAFIQKSTTKQLYAYLTQLGRKYVLNGNKEDFQVAYFSLHDDDTNYFVASNLLSASTYNILSSGFIPDLSGDNESCIKSVSIATDINKNTSLSGSTVLINGLPSVGIIGTDGEINTRLLSVGFSSVGSNITSSKLGPNNPTTVNLIVSLSDIPTLNESNNINLKISVYSHSIGITNIKINDTLNSNIISLSGNTAKNITIPISFEFSGSIQAGIIVPYDIMFKVEPYRSFLTQTNNIYTLQIARGTITPQQ